MRGLLDANRQTGRPRRRPGHTRFLVVDAERVLRGQVAEGTFPDLCHEPHDDYAVDRHGRILVHHG